MLLIEKLKILILKTRLKLSLRQEPIGMKFENAAHPTVMKLFQQTFPQIFT